MVVQKSNIGHLKKIIRYKALKLLGSYLSSKRQERVHDTVLIRIRVHPVREFLNNIWGLGTE
jgi:hypothetical protein